MTVTLPEMLSCARRELALRRSAYPRWIAAGKMSRDKADHEIACMEAIVKWIERNVMLNESLPHHEDWFGKQNADGETEVQNGKA